MNILFVCGLYGRSTNGILESILAQELHKRGHEVYIVGMTTTDQFKEVNLDGVHTFGVANPWFHEFNEKYGGRKDRLSILYFHTVRLIRNLGVTLTFPNVNPVRSRRLWRFCRHLVEQYSIDLAFCTFQPYEAIITSIKTKKQFGDRVKVVNYHLDLISSPANSSGAVVQWKTYLAHRSLQRELKVVDCLMLPESAELLQLKSDKITYVGFPAYILNHPAIKMPFVFDKSNVNVVFCGTLDASNRNPMYALRMLEKIGKIEGRNLKIHIWGGISNQQLKDEIMTLDCVDYHGFINSFYIPYILRSADYLLNISNKLTYNMIPSKTFQQLAAHRPIINFVKHPQDYSLRYFEQCGYTLRINEYENDSDFNYNALVDYLRDYLNKDVVYDDSLYVKSTPQYIAEIIESKK